MDIQAFTLQALHPKDVLYRHEQTFVTCLQNTCDDAVMVYVYVDGKLVAKEPLPPLGKAALQHPQAGRLVFPPKRTSRRPKAGAKLPVKVVFVPCAAIMKPAVYLPSVQASSGHATCCIIQPAIWQLEELHEASIIQRLTLFVIEPEPAVDHDYTDSSKGDEQPCLLSA